jgi:hypothetical protein
LAALKANPQALAARKQDYQNTLDELKRILDVYRDYDEVVLMAINARESFEVQRLDPRQPARDKLQYEQLRRLNHHRRMGIYFAPVPPVTDNAERFKIVFLHDVPVSQVTKLPPGTVIVQSSDYRYDAHIPITTPLLAGEVTEAQRALCSLSGASRVAVECGHYRRLPGFANPDYPETPLVRIRDDLGLSERPILIPKLAEKLREQRSLQQEAAARFRRRGDTKKLWIDFFAQVPDRDCSAADQAYASYLSGQGYGTGEIREALKAESEDLWLRSGAYLDEYLDRILQKAAGPKPGGVPTTPLPTGPMRNSS